MPVVNNSTSGRARKRSASPLISGTNCSNTSVIQRAASRPSRPPMSASSRHSTIHCRTSVPRHAPSAIRTANSPVRRLARTKRSVAMQQLVDNGEHRHIGADAQGKREDRDRDETRVSPRGAPCVAKWRETSSMRPAP